MGYREMIKAVQMESGFSDTESEEALVHTVESIAERLTADERKDFASQLPPELQEVAMSAERSSAQESMLDEFMETYELEEMHAKKRLMAAWEVLKRAISRGEIEHIKAQLPNDTVALLH